MLVKNAPVLLFCVDIKFQFWVFVEERVGSDVVSLASPSGFNGWFFFCSGIQLYVLLNSYLRFTSCLYLDLYVLDDASISYGSFM